ncbi:MAG: ATP-binding protein [Planctomycetota bacterium]
MRSKAPSRRSFFHLGLRHKVVLTTVGVLLVCSTTTGFLFYQISSDTVTRSYQDDCREVARFLSWMAAAWITRNGPVEIPLRLVMTARGVEYAAIYSSEGKLLHMRSQGDHKPPISPPVDHRPHLLTLGGEQIMQVDREIHLPALAQSEAPGGASWHQMGWTRVGLSMTIVQEQIAVLKRRIALVVAVLVAAGGIIAYLMTSHFLWPIERLREGVTAIGKSDFGYRVDVRTRDEIGVLAQAFNTMAGDLKTSKEELSRYNRRLEEMVRERTAELHRALEELKVLDKLKDDFLSSVSHELRTPLTSIRSFSEILLEVGAEDEATRQEFLGIIRSESERLTRLVNDILDLMKIEAGEMTYDIRDIDVGEVVESCVSSLAPLLKEGQLHVRTHVAEDVPPIPADRDKLLQVLHNLLGNAVKFSPPGSWIDLEISATDYLVRVEVRDHGSGVLAEHLESIFERFRQVGDPLRDKPRGTGLGLPICRSIVEGLGGRIWAELPEGPGLRVVFELPLYPTAVQGASAREDGGAHLSSPEGVLARASVRAHEGAPAEDGASVAAVPAHDGAPREEEASDRAIALADGEPSELPEGTPAPADSAPQDLPAHP